QTADRMHRLTRTEIPAIKCSGLRRGKREGVAAAPCGGELAIESRGVTCRLRVKGFRLSRPAGLRRAAPPVATARPSDRPLRHGQNAGEMARGGFRFAQAPQRVPARMERGIRDADGAFARMLRGDAISKRGFADVEELT